MRTRSGCGMPPSAVSACGGGSPSGHTPSSSARRSSDMCDSRTGSQRWWSNVGYRKNRPWSSGKCLSGSRMPPFRRVPSCSPSASARTVTAHSLKAIGIREEVWRSGIRTETIPPTNTNFDLAVIRLAKDPRAGRSHTMHKVRNSQNPPGNCRKTDPHRSPGGSGSSHTLDHLDHGGEVLLAEPAADPDRVELARERSERKSGAVRTRLVEAQADVLEH